MLYSNQWQQVSSVLQIHLSQVNLLVSVYSANQVRASLPAHLYLARHLRPVLNNPLALQAKPHPYLVNRKHHKHRQHSLLDKIPRAPRVRLARPLQVHSVVLPLRNRSHSSMSASAPRLWHSRQPPLVFLVNPRLQMLASQNQRDFSAHQQLECLQVVS